MQIAHLGKGVKTLGWCALLCNETFMEQSASLYMVATGEYAHNLVNYPSFNWRVYNNTFRSKCQPVIIIAYTLQVFM